MEQAKKKIIRKVKPAAAMPRLERVAAYCRVSSGKDAMLHSLSTQVSRYSEFIQRHPGWAYAGVYADEALTGTKDDRPENRPGTHKIHQPLRPQHGYAAGNGA